MKKILETILNSSNGEITSDNYLTIKNFLAGKSREEINKLIIEIGNPKLIEYFIKSDIDILECYAMIGRRTLQSFSDQIYKILLENKDEDLILKYFDDIKFDYLKKNLIVFVYDEQKKINYIKKNGYGWDNSKFIVYCSLNSDISKISCLEYVRDLRDKVVLINTITDEYLRARALMTLVPNYRYMVCETITNQDILRNLYHKNIDCSWVYKILLLIHDDEFKKSELERYNIIEQVEIINSFDCEENIHKIIWDSKYDDCCEGFFERVQNEEFIIKYFNKSDNIKFKIKLINGIKNKILKKKLILLLDDLEYQNILLGNINQDKATVLKNVPDPVNKYDIDPRITIGVELEACCDYPDVYLGIKKLLCDWDIKLDRSVLEGLEVTSPILHYDSTSIKELKFICDFLNRNKFYTDDSCGGHLHFGFNYFENIEQFRMFLNLYQSVEDILYLICNRADSVVRNRIDNYAHRLNPVLKRIASLDVNWNKRNDLTEYVTIVKKSCGSRYFGLNLSNVFEEKNTIEFRMPNGEINFNEVILNIRLFAKLMEISKRLASILNETQLSDEEKELLEIYSRLLLPEHNNREKLADLLRLLFPENEREAYIERYTTNRKIAKKIRQKS